MVLIDGSPRLSLSLHIVYNDFYNLYAVCKPCDLHNDDNYWRKADIVHTWWHNVDSIFQSHSTSTDYGLFSQIAIWYCTTKEGGPAQAKGTVCSPIRKLSHEKAVSCVLAVLCWPLHACFVCSKDLHGRKNSRWFQLWKQQQNYYSMLVITVARDCLKGDKDVRSPRKTCQDSSLQEILILWFWQTKDGLDAHKTKFVKENLSTVHTRR
jgi:hypothetical protein